MRDLVAMRPTTNARYQRARRMTAILFGIIVTSFLVGLGCWLTINKLPERSGGTPQAIIVIEDVSKDRLML